MNFSELLTNFVLTICGTMLITVLTVILFLIIHNAYTEIKSILIGTKNQKKNKNNKGKKK